MTYHNMFSSLLLFPLIFFPICSSADTITPNQSVRDGETLVSAGGKFALGFFSPANSKNRYIGIWYNKIPDHTLVWTANRENPVRDSTGVLTISGGNLVLLDGRHGYNTTLWSTNVSRVADYSTTAGLMDSGNLVLRDDHGRVLWESFDYPTNTLLTEMKFGWDRRTRLNRVLTSWKSTDDPAPGEFSIGLDPRGMPQFFLTKGSDLIWRSGPWNGKRFSGIPGADHSSVFRYAFVANDDEVYFRYYSINDSVLARNILDSSGAFRWMMWSDERRRWNLLWVANQDMCDQYAHCGAYGSCDPNREDECTCLRGFEPKTHGNRWDGCVRRRPLDCGGKGDGFFRLAHVKQPDTSRSRVEPHLSLEACEVECLKNCSCTAYASANISEGGSGCLMWFSDLIDLRVYSGEGQDIYARVAASELDKNSHGEDFRGKKKLLVTLLIVILVLLSFVLCGFCWRRKAKGDKMNGRYGILFNDKDFEENSKSSELQLYNLSVIALATNNFSKSNMVGEGGFGSVYKGQLLNGQEIAVKRLSKNSGQGTEEFKNEVTLIAKLQHRNLVRLLGYCLSGQEKILIYEYMRNKSLDSLIFVVICHLSMPWVDFSR